MTQPIGDLLTIILTEVKINITKSGMILKVTWYFVYYDPSMTLQREVCDRDGTDHTVEMDKGDWKDLKSEFVVFNRQVRNKGH